MNEKKAIIACTPVNLPPDAPPYPHTHYAKWRCPFCNELMYVGPRSIEKHRRDGTLMVCMLCAVRGGANTDNVKHLGGP